MTEPMLGSSRDMARAWAERDQDCRQFPLAPRDRDDLPQLAQYLAVKQKNPLVPLYKLEESLRAVVLDRYAPIPGELADEQTPLDALLGWVGAQRRERDPAEPHRVLAGLPFPLYITANPDNLLAEALEAAGKRPQVVLCPWNDLVAGLTSVYDERPEYKPTPAEPLIYHLFGRYSELDSLVLTEDAYFDYLIGVTRNWGRIPIDVRRALAKSSLLFLGFLLDDWKFRVIFRSLIEQEGSAVRKGLLHLGVQVEPDEDRMLDPRGARAYLEQYLELVGKIDIYWGSSEDFIQELLRHSVTQAAAERVPSGATG